MIELDDCFPGIALSYNLSEISSVLDDCDYCPWTLRGFGFFFSSRFQKNSNGDDLQNLVR